MEFLARVCKGKFMAKTRKNEINSKEYLQIH